MSFQHFVESLSPSVKRFVRKGIPHSMRTQVWLAASGAQKVKAHHPNLFHLLLAQSEKNDNREAVEQIQKGAN